MNEANSLDPKIRNAARRAKRAAKETENHLAHLQELANQQKDAETADQAFTNKHRARNIQQEANRILRRYNAPAGETE